MLEINKIYNINCLDGLKQLNENSIDCIITSPPYLSMRNYTGEKNQFGYFYSKDRYLKDIINIFKYIPKILKKTGSFVLNIDDIFNREWQQIQFKLVNLLKEYLILQETFIWIKKNPQPYQSVQRVTHGYEYCFLFIKNNLEFKFQKEKNEFITDTFFCKIGNRGQSDHIAVFPKELPEFFIKLLTKENDLVLDIFSGSGTTLQVAKKLNRNFIGFEINKKYYEYSVERLNETKIFSEKTNNFF